MDEIKEDKVVEGQVVLTLYTDRTFSIGTSVTLDDTLDVMEAAIWCIENDEMEGLDEMRQFTGTVQ
jgi:hypothetical protein